MVSEKSTILKLIYEYKPLETKTKNSLIEAKLLLFITNSTIGNFSV